MLQILEDPSHEEYDSYLQWLGERFDPEGFDLAKTNKALQRMDR